jgi:hypothetical protein
VGRLRHSGDPRSIANRAVAILRKTLGTTRDAAALDTAITLFAMSIRGLCGGAAQVRR